VLPACETRVGRTAKHWGGEDTDEEPHRIGEHALNVTFPHFRTARSIAHPHRFVPRHPRGAIAFGLWTASLARLSPTQVAVYINLNPVVAATLGVLLLSERATPVFVLSFVAVIVGVILVNWPVPERSGV
jgi:hypothetical protein